MLIREGSLSTLDLYLINDNSPLILVVPGGGYDHTSPRESMPVAKKFNNMGYNAAVLNYRISLNPHPAPMLDLAVSIKILKKYSKEIILCGFSAGGHLIGSYLCHYNKPFILDEIASTSELQKINYAIFCYPVITSGEFKHDGSFNNLTNNSNDSKLLDLLSVEKNITSDYPECFIWSTFTDSSVPVENSLLLMNALKKNNINFEAHIFPIGGHGLSLANEDTARDEKDIIPYIQKWSSLVSDWLKLKLDKE